MPSIHIDVPPYYVPVSRRSTVFLSPCLAGVVDRRAFFITVESYSEWSFWEPTVSLAGTDGWFKRAMVASFAQAPRHITDVPKVYVEDPDSQRHR